MMLLLITLFALLLGGSLHAQTTPFRLAELPYAADALEPAISRQTVELHHDRHLAAYVNKLNELVAGTEYARMPLEEIVAKADGAVFNNAGQVLNHNLYFAQFSPQGGGCPHGALAEAIDRQWGSFAEFRAEFVKRGLSLFGSGWVWLAQADDGTLMIVQEVNGGNPVASGRRPILGFDVWEHAYYPDYQNRRADYLAAIWDVIDWPVVEKRFDAGLVRQQ